MICGVLRLYYDDVHPSWSMLVVLAQMPDHGLGAVVSVQRTFLIFATQAAFDVLPLVRIAGGNLVKYA